MSAITRRRRRALRESQEERLVRSIIREMLMPAPRVQYLTLQVEGFPLGGDWVRDVLGYRIPLNEGPIDERLIRRIIREGLDVAGWLDKARQAVGVGVDALKKQVTDTQDAIDKFGENIRGASVALWVAGQTGDFATLANKAADAFTKTIEKVIDWFKKSALLLRKIFIPDSSDEKPADSSTSDSKKSEEGMNEEESGSSGSDAEVKRDPGSFFEKTAEYLSKIKQFVTSKEGLALVSAAVAGACGVRWMWEHDKFGPVKNFITGIKIAYEKTGKKGVLGLLGVGAVGGITWLLSDAFRGFIEDLMKKFAASAIVRTFAGPIAWLKDLADILGKAAWVVGTISSIIAGVPVELGIEEPPAVGKERAV